MGGYEWLSETIGGSRVAMTSTGEDPPEVRNVEYIIQSRSRSPGLAEVLAGLASYPYKQSMALGPGHTIAGEEPIVEASQLMDLLITLPYFYEEGFRPLNLKRGGTV